MKVTQALVFSALALGAYAGDFRVAAEGGRAEIQQAIDAAAAAGGGRVVVAPGVHPIGTLRLKSHVELHLEKGAVLLGGTKRDDYDGIDFDAGRRPRHATRRAKAVRPIQGRVVGDAESVIVEVRSRVRQA